MGIMSKTNRLPERPKPPSWEEVTDDITSAPSSDVVFVLGQECLASTAAEASIMSVLEKTYTTSSNSLEAESPSIDTSQLDPEKVKTSNANVLKLIDLYTELTDSIVSLQDQHQQLKVIGEDLSESSSKLKVLALNIPTNMDDKLIKKSASEKDSSKGKSKQKKKK